MWAETYTIN